MVEIENQTTYPLFVEKVLCLVVQLPRNPENLDLTRSEELTIDRIAQFCGKSKETARLGQLFNTAEGGLAFGRLRKCRRRRNSRTTWVVLNLWPADQACDTNLFGEILWVLRGQVLERTVASHVYGDGGRDRARPDDEDSNHLCPWYDRFEFSRRRKMVGVYYQGSLMQGAMPDVDAESGEVVESESL